ncbi:hypothetical protein CLOM_g15534 [Closterium sp. NIES-68]|nr:hypothetical protein CLOM_g15534 [Closterium sp. NIES-68]
MVPLVRKGASDESLSSVPRHLRLIVTVLLLLFPAHTPALHASNRVGVAVDSNAVSPTDPSIPSSAAASSDATTEPIVGSHRLLGDAAGGGATRDVGMREPERDGGLRRGAEALDAFPPCRSLVRQRWWLPALARADRRHARAAATAGLLSLRASADVPLVVAMAGDFLAGNLSARKRVRSSGRASPAIRSSRSMLSSLRRRPPPPAARGSPAGRTPPPPASAGKKAPLPEIASRSPVRTTGRSPPSQKAPPPTAKKGKKKKPASPSPPPPRKKGKRKRPPPPSPPAARSPRKKRPPTAPSPPPPRGSRNPAQKPPKSPPPPRPPRPPSPPPPSPPQPPRPPPSPPSPPAPPSPPPFGVQSPDCQYGSDKSLAECAMGYAGAAGVRGAQAVGLTRYTVDSEFDTLDGSQMAVGSLRWAVTYLREGAYIQFARSMDIVLQGNLYVRSRTTIDGQGFHVRLTNGTLVLQNAADVIVHNVEVSGTSSDLILVYNSSRVWVDHCRLVSGRTGTVDVGKGSTDVTISNCYISNAAPAMQLGLSDGEEADRMMRVTLYRNWFDASPTMQPLCRKGSCHVAANLYTRWSSFCIAARKGAVVRSEKNFFRPDPVGGRLEVTPWYGGMLPTDSNYDKTASIRSVEDYLVGGATFHEWVGSNPLFTPPYSLGFFRNTRLLEAFLMLNCGPKYDTLYTAAAYGAGMLACAVGFAAGQAGQAGLAGIVAVPEYVVTLDEDVASSSRQGSLRWAIGNFKGGVRISFARSMTIRLAAVLYVKSNTMIDGRGVNVKLTGDGIVVVHSSQVVIHNVELACGSASSSAHVVLYNSTAVWIDHCRFSNISKAALDVSRLSTAITISNCHFAPGAPSASTLLLGSSDSDTSLSSLMATLYRNWFDRAPPGQPVCRRGSCHVANNLVSGWAGAAMDARMGGQVLLENTLLTSGPASQSVVAAAATNPPGTVVSMGSVLSGSAVWGPVAAPGTLSFTPPYSLPSSPLDASFVQFIKSNAGPHEW